MGGGWSRNAQTELAARGTLTHSVAGRRIAGAEWGAGKAVDGRWDGWEDGRVGGVRCVGYRLKNVQRHRIFDDGSCILPV